MMSDGNNTEELSFINIVKSLNFDIEQNQLNSGPPPTLKFILLSKIATKLWYDHLRYNDLKLLKQNDVYDNLDVFESYGNEIISKVNELKIPIECKNDLKNVICSVRNEIMNYINFYCTLYHENKVKLKIFLDNICWTQQNTINILKTIMKIINISDLNIKAKYEIACYYCLEENIRDLSKELPENIIKEFEDESFSFTSFWTSYIRNDELPTLINGEPAREFLLNYTLRKGNAISVQNIFAKFGDEEAMERLMHFSDLCVRECPDALFYFVKHMTPLQLEASPSIHLTVLSTLRSLSRWCDVFSISNYLMEFFRTKDVIYNFELISRYLCLNDLEVEEFLNIWNKFVLHFKSDIEMNIVHFYQINLECKYTYYCSTKKQCIIAKLLQGMTTSQNRSELIYNNELSEFWIWLIFRFGIKRFKYFLDIIFKPEEIFQLKENFLTNGILGLCTDLSIANSYEVLDEALIEFCAEENIKEFKRELVYKDNAYIFLEFADAIIDDKTADVIPRLTKYLSWCFEGNKHEMKICRKIVFDVESELYSDVREIFFYQIYIFMIEKKWKLVKQYWQWFYYSTEDIITTSKEKWERVKKILYLISRDESFLTFLQGVNRHILVIHFIRTCFKDDELVKIKEEIQNSKDLPLTIYELIKRNKKGAATDFLHFCYSSDINKIENFIEIFIKLYGSSLMFELISSEVDTDIIISILNWFDISDESKNLFKENFFEYFENKRKTQIENPELSEEGLLMSENDWKLFIEKVDQIFHF